MNNGFFFENLAHFLNKKCKIFPAFAKIEYEFSKLGNYELKSVIKCTLTLKQIDQIGNFN